MHTEPAEQHRWLHRLIGAWRYESECPAEPGKPPVRATGTEVVRAVGDLWIVAESEGEMPGGGTMRAVMTLGYDPAKARFVGTWIGSPMAFMFVYEGVRAADGVSLPLDTVGPSFADPTKMARYQDVVELHPDGRRVLWSQCLGEDGTWTRFMTANYTRTG